MASTSLKQRLTIIDIDELREHEEINPELLDKLRKEIAADGVLKLAIAVDEKTKTVIDGHHRIQALKQLGYKKIPVVLIDYMSPEIVVQTWKEGMKVTKEEVLEAALLGKKMTPK